MLIEMILSPIFALIKSLFGWINLDSLDLPFWISDTLSLLKKAMMFFPLDVWVVVIVNILLWLTVQFTWSIIEWIYRKIPGIN